MASRPPDSEFQSSLRREAEAQLQKGTAPRTRTPATAFDALEVLFGMAIVPSGASGALKLLHELQVHQVELDLQHEQLEQSQRELCDARDDCVERFDFAPIPYFVIGRDGRIIEANLAAGESFGLEPSALGGRRIDSLLAPRCQLACRGLLKKLGGGSASESCEVLVDGSGDAVRRYRMVATSSPGGRSFLVMLIDKD